MKNRKIKNKINTTFSTWTKLVSDVRQGSGLGPLLFSFYLNYLFLFLDISICNIADDAMPFVCDQALESVLQILQRSLEITIFWFSNNYMKLNTDNFHLLISEPKHKQTWAEIGEDKIWESSGTKLLGEAIDNNLNFDSHIANIISKPIKSLV